MAKRKNNVCISNDKLDDLIWMSYRYCIGRKTIAAAMHADTILSIIKNNPDILSEERKIFMATDIRREINNVVAFEKNVYVAGTNDFDAFSTLLYSLDGEESFKYKYTVDSYTGEVEKKDISNDNLHQWDTFENEYVDLIEWVKLANILDVKCHKRVYTNFNGEEKEYICYSYPYRKEYGIYEERWTSIDKDLIIGSYIAPEYIVKIDNVTEL